MGYKRGVARGIMVSVYLMVLTVMLLAAGCFCGSMDKVWAQEGADEARVQERRVNYDFASFNEFGGKVRGLRNENKDVKAWIRIDGTMINYPLLQSNDNSYYLKRSYNGEDSFYGSIFMNCRSNLRDDFSNIIIYGHNMKDKQMFGDLTRYADKSFYDANPIVRLTTEENESLYQVIHVFRSRVWVAEEEDVFRYYGYGKFFDEETFNEYIAQCQAKEMYDTGVTATYGDQLMALTTCEYTQKNGRFVVVAKKVGDVFDG